MPEPAGMTDDGIEPMITLYAAVGSCSLCAHVALIEGGLDHQVRYVTLRAADSPLAAINPLGKVPTVQLPDGEVVAQSMVVLPLLADLAPQAGLLPLAGTLARRQVLQWLAFLNTDVHPAMKMLAGAARYCADAEGLRRSFTPILRGYFELIDSTLADRSWLTGESFTLADIYAGAVYRWAQTYGGPLAGLDRYTAFAGRFEARDSVRQARAMEAACQVPTSA